MPSRWPFRNGASATTTSTGGEPQQDPVLVEPRPQRRGPQPIELGTINYVNLTTDGKHGDYEVAMKVARETGKPIFANFVEWSG
mmetsp:Transcript_21756/g.60474  ORF Transcript_21756/g.60474 Transcript_21756/m.60474 type:complete len:84 (+) Transcript_21756:126-377(+)